MSGYGIAGVVLAAGLGTRMRSQRPKVLHELAGEPLLTYPLRLLRAVGADPIVVVVGPNADEVRRVAAPFGVRFAVQATPRGTGDATRAAVETIPNFPGDLVIMPSDLPLIEEESLRRLLQAHIQQEAVLTLLTAELAEPRGFGRIVREQGNGGVLCIVEEADCTPQERAIREVNAGVYCVNLPFLARTLPQLGRDNAQQEFYLTDVVARARANGLPIATAKATAEEVVQVSDRVDLARCERLFRERITRRWMHLGVTFLDPQTATVGPLVDIGEDAVIGPQVALYGKTRVGPATRIDGCARIVNSQLGARCHVKLGVVMEEAELADEVSVGPFAHLRPGSTLGERVRIGNFVETKNARLAPGVKANHLAYLGDAEIGAETNIGAGTITCNFDGFRKHKTIIGARVQVGSDSQFVAPVRVGDDAYIATATTVRKDVSAGALVYNPRSQRERAGWVAARRAKEGQHGNGEPEREG